MNDVDVMIAVGVVTAALALLLSGPIRSLLIISGIIVAALGLLRRLTER